MGAARYVFGTGGRTGSTWAISRCAPLALASCNAWRNAGREALEKSDGWRILRNSRPLRFLTITVGLLERGSAWRTSPTRDLPDPCRRRRPHAKRCNCEPDQKMDKQRERAIDIGYDNSSRRGPFLLGCPPLFDFLASSSTPRHLQNGTWHRRLGRQVRDDRSTMTPRAEHAVVQTLLGGDYGSPSVTARITRPRVPAQGDAFGANCPRCCLRNTAISLRNCAGTGIPRRDDTAMSRDSQGPEQAIRVPGARRRRSPRASTARRFTA